jgi:hypothetical protein
MPTRTPPAALLFARTPVLRDAILTARGNTEDDRDLADYLAEEGLDPIDYIFGVTYPTRPGFYVWEGEVRPYEDAAEAWVGRIRPAEAADFAEFGLPVPARLGQGRPEPARA